MSTVHILHVHVSFLSTNFYMILCKIFLNSYDEMNSHKHEVSGRINPLPILHINMISVDQTSITHESNNCPQTKLYIFIIIQQFPIFEGFKGALDWKIH